jgi:DNA repair protein RadA/Sms
MAKQKLIFVCQDCGDEFPRWTGQCSSCQAWNTIVEEVARGSLPEVIALTRKSTNGRPTKSVSILDVSESDSARTRSGVQEIDRVLGGGIVRGCAVLVAGSPGIGKSTLMSVLGNVQSGASVLYVAGEESPSQIKMRATRLGISSGAFRLFAETNLESIIQVVLDEEPTILIVDSIQTLFRLDIQSAPGSVAQVRECASALIQLAKSSGISLFIVGHVTKDGSIAGPKILEHMVDTVLSLEGDRHHSFRILRAVKNRFGSTNEIGVFEMRGTGLIPVDNPSKIFLSDRVNDIAGATVVSSMEGTRPILAEIQALVSDSAYAHPQRTATGYDGKRLQMLLAVLEKRGGLRLADSDVFVNVTGGLRLTEPAIDVGIVAAVASSLLNRAIDRHAVFVGEIGLGGEIRGVAHLAARISEAKTLGFKRVFVPESDRKDSASIDGLEIIGLDSVQQLLERAL